MSNADVRLVIWSIELATLLSLFLRTKANVKKNKTVMFLFTKITNFRATQWIVIHIRRLKVVKPLMLA